MRSASKSLGERKSRTPATQKAQSVQAYRQRTKQQVKHAKWRTLSGLLWDEVGEKEAFKRKREKFQKREGLDGGRGLRMHHPQSKLAFSICTLPSSQAQPKPTFESTRPYEKLHCHTPLPLPSFCRPATNNKQRANYLRVNPQKRLLNQPANRGRTSHDGKALRRNSIIFRHSWSPSKC
jgi:hypothetical protein